MDFDVVFYIAQGISVLNAFVATFSAQLKNMKTILAAQIIMNLLAAVTCFLLGGFSGVGISIIAVVQTIVMYFYSMKDKKPHVAVTALFVVVYILNSVITFSSIFDIFPTLAAVSFALSVAQRSSKAYRLVGIWNPLFWLVYDVYIDAYANIVLHSCIFISMLIACIRLDGFFGLIKKHNSEK